MSSKQNFDPRVEEDRNINLPRVLKELQVLKQLYPETGAWSPVLFCRVKREYDYFYKICLQ